MTPGRRKAPLFFANASMFRQEIRRRVNSSDAHWVVIQCEAITDIDVTAADMLEQLDRELNQRGVLLVFVELRSRLHDLVTRYGLLEALDRRHFYNSIDEALADITGPSGPVWGFACLQSRDHEFRVTPSERAGLLPTGKRRS
jgi:MFS superfamily sulfate permease-like transporter